MKIPCDHCGKDIKKQVRAPFDNFRVGRIKCEHCKNKNKRYISELDLMIGFLFNSFIYAFGVISTLLAYLFLPDVVGIWVTIIVVILILVFAYFSTTYATYAIYRYGYFKEAWKNEIIQEDAEEVAKRMRWQFIIFIAVTLVVGTQFELFYLFLAMYVAIFGVTVVKTYLLHKKELSLFLENKVTD